MNLEEAIRTREALRGARAEWDAWWQEINELCLPRRAYITQSNNTPDDTHANRLFDTTAVDAVQVLANGHASYITPPSERWFSWAPPAHLRGNDEAEQWYASCTEVAMEALAGSNFYTEVHEVYLDRSAPGTAAMWVGDGIRSPLSFRFFSVGSYSLAENPEGDVDTICREWQWTAAQIRQAFPDVDPGAQVTGCLQSPGRAHTQKFTCAHLVLPRLERDPRKIDKLNMPFESVYFLPDQKVLLSTGGFEEFPYLVTRFLKWGHDSPYGLSPARMALPTIRQLNFLQRMMDTLAQVAAFPRVKQLATQIGEIDLRAAGVTVVDERAAGLGLPGEWATGGRYDVGKDRIKDKQEHIREQFHVPLFRMWDSLEKAMTATEVTAREREKLLLFSPSFSRFIADMRPAMARVFALLLRAGRFQQPPSAILERTRDGVMVPDPEVVWQSKIALAVKQLGVEGFDRLALRLQALVPHAPDVLDNIDFDVAVRMLARSEGVPNDMLRSWRDVLEVRAAKADAQRQAVDMQMAQAAAGAARDVAAASDKIAIPGLGI